MTDTPTVATMFSQLQWQQRQHDIAYHSDIWQLPPQRSLTHMTLHQTKYMAALGRALVTGDQQALSKTLTDAFAITLATANILNQDLATLAAGAPKAQSFGELGCVMLRTGVLPCDAFDSAAVSARYADLCGAMAKACEAFDHAEDYPSRTVMATSNADICRLVVALAAARNVDLSVTYQARIAAVEGRSVFNAQVEKTRSDKPAAAPAARAPEAQKDGAGAVTRGTIHQHR